MNPERNSHEALSEIAALIDRGDLDAADKRVVAALAGGPGNSLLINLQAYLHLRRGRYGKACELYETIARRHPDSGALRVNAALAALLGGDLVAAYGHLRGAVACEPDNRRAFGYLAVIHASRGEPELARAALLEAGVADLAASLEELEPAAAQLAVRTAADALGPSRPRPPAWEGFIELPPLAGLAANAEDPEAAFDAAFESAIGADDAPAMAPPDAGGDATEDAAPQPSPRAVPRPQSGRLVLPIHARRPAKLTARPSPPAEEELPVGIDRLDELRLLQGGGARAGAALEGDRLQLWLGDGPSQRAGVCMREDLLVIAAGGAEMEPVVRRRKGLSHDPFVVGGAAFVRVRGAGARLASPSHDARFELIELVDEAVYVVEAGLAAFSTRLRWENGWIPGIRLPAVHLAGEGFVALVGRGPISRVTCSEGSPVLVRRDCLVGWWGDVVPCAPRPGVGQALLECDGQGVLMLCADGGSGGATAVAPS